MPRSSPCPQSGTWGWITAIGWEHGFRPDIADQLLQGALLVEDEALAERMRAQAEAAIEQHGVRGLELGFRRGDAVAALEGLRTSARNAIASQHPGGYWNFSQVYSMEGNRATLAEPDDVEIGTCLNRLHPILRYALVSGDPVSLESGLRGLRYIERFVRPAGSESWEVPLVNPNLRAAALACECYLHAYRLTGEQHYLERARYWAWTGVPFIYLWEAPDRPVMPGASISVFGTTFYTHPWFGAAVQWVGLVYASSLQYLADYDDSFPWRDVAELIAVSAMKQQETPEDEGGHVGYYPDAYHVVRGREYYDWDLAPTGIIANVIGLMGREPWLTTKIVPGCTPPVHINTIATPTGANYDADGETLSVDLRYYAAETSQVVICGVSVPDAVLWDGNALAQVADVATVDEGWAYVTLERLLVCKLPWTEETGTLELRGVSPVPFREVLPPDRLLNGGFEKGLRGWRCDPTATASEGRAHSGQWALAMNAPDPAKESQATSSPMLVTAGTSYRLSAYVWQQEGDGDYKVTVDWQDGAGRHIRYDNDWAGNDRPREYTLHDGTFTAPEGAAQAAIILGARGAHCLMDDVELVRVTEP